MSASPNPRVSIGLPVYNGQQYLQGAIESILAQTYQDFELVICDNASTDETAAICEQYAAREPRIRFHRHAQNIGAAANFNSTFELSRGSYFKWAAHDDLLAPTYLERCVAALERTPDAVLCQSLVQIIDAHGDCLQIYNHAASGTDRPRPSERFAARLVSRPCMEIFGLIRADALRGTGLIRHHLGSDRTLLVELALLGRFALVPDALFLNREHPQRFKRQHRHPRSELAWYTPKKAGGNGLSGWRMLRTWILYAKSLRLIHDRVEELPERMRCYWHLLASVRFHQRWQYLLLEPLALLNPELVDRVKSIKRAVLRQQRPHATADQGPTP
jgi:glycosyltransferase involved in cell wall biosynthesis